MAVHNLFSYWVRFESFPLTPVYPEIDDTDLKGTSVFKQQLA